MEKLIELLNEYSKKNHNLAMRELNGELGQGFHYLSSGSSYSELLMISKKYEFIKRLVENDKIDFERILTNIEGKFRIEFYMKFEGVITFSDVELILMYLAISDKPIDDLINLLN